MITANRGVVPARSRSWNHDRRQPTYNKGLRCVQPRF